MGYHNLGYSYLTGQGVRQNFEEAKEYFGKACDMGRQKGCDGYKFLNEQGH
ncbi:Sel1 repeat protein [Helicobacter monodelphidis]|nr:Sel1 repeat protein [Helicobacter sp. 15-1451]